MIRILFLLAWLLAVVPARAETTLDGLYHEALQEDPGVRAAYEEWQARVEGIARAEGWPDPQLGWGWYLAEVETALGPQRQRLSLSQRIPWPGKLGLRGEAAAAGARVAERQLRAEELELYREVAGAYYDLAYLARAVAVHEEMLELLRFQERLARTRFATGDTPHPDVLRAQIELDALADRLQGLRDRRPALEAALNAALGRAGDAPLPWPLPLSREHAPLPDADTLLQRIASAHPLPQLHETEARRENRRAAAARRDRYPDITVGVQTILTDESTLTTFDDRGRDAWIGTLSLNLPLWRGKYRAAIAEAEARERAATARAEDARQQLDARGQRALYRAEDADRRIGLYRDRLVPRGQEALRSIARAYQTGTATLLDLLDAERSLLAFQLELERAHADRGQADAELRALMADLPERRPRPEDER